MINSASNQEQFYLSGSDVNYMIDYFGWNVLTGVNVWYWSYDTILDTSIGNYKNGVWIWERIVKDFVESVNVSILDFCIFIEFIKEWINFI